MTNDTDHHDDRDIYTEPKTRHDGAAAMAALVLAAALIVFLAFQVVS